MKILNYKQKNFKKKLENLLKKHSSESVESINIELEVKKILKEVKHTGNKAIIKYSKKFDDINLNKNNLRIPKKTLESYKNKVDQRILKSFKIAIDNVKNFHKKQLPKNYQINKNGIKTGSFWKPLESVGLYIPGGNAVYPSSLIMNVIPAKVAGVKRIVVTTPSQNGNFSPYILAILDFLKIKEVYQLGGAQAIAALAYGTDTINPVNKIFGPGNAYVTSAKKNVFGKVGIDLIAGPSEIVVVADNKNNPDWVAADLIAQAEHDEKAQSILITNSLNFAEKVVNSINNLIKNLPRKNIIKKSLSNYGAIIILDDLKKSTTIIDYIAPEHLHLHNKLQEYIYNKVLNVGAIFLGEFTCEAFGDYIVGTNHVLPTSGTAKFSSGLNVLDFMKRTSFVKMNKKSSKELTNHVSKMATIEKLEGHKLSVSIRQKQKK